MGTEAPTTVTLPVHCAPQKAPCPKCGKHGRRARKLTPRLVRTVASKTIVYLEGSSQNRVGVFGLLGSANPYFLRVEPTSPMLENLSR